VVKKKAGASPPETYTDIAWQEKREKGNALRREMLLLTRKVGRNPLAAAYYTQMKDLLEEILMMELAQKAVEATMKCNTQNKIICVTDTSLAPFRTEMEKAKTLKLIAGVLSLSGHLDVDGAVELAMSALYGPRDKEKPAEKEGKLLAQLQAMLDGYAKKIESTVMAAQKKASKGSLP
jgi:hypothetical protein